MKLIGIITKVILEDIRDREDIPSDEDVEDMDLKHDVEVDRETPRREPEDREREDREREREDREREDREREEERIDDRERQEREREDLEDREREQERRELMGKWICKDPVNFPRCQQIRDDAGVQRTIFYGFPYYNTQRDCISNSPCSGEVIRRPITRPTVTTVRPIDTTSEPRQTSQPQTSQPQTTQSSQSTEEDSVPEINMKTKFDSDDKIGDIKKIQSNKLIKIIEDKLVKQLDLQPQNVKQKLNQFKIKPKTMSYLVPLSLETGTLMSKMEMDGLNLPLMMLLYSSSNNLYESMKNNTPFKPEQAKPIGGPISYKNFWSWSENIYDNWGPWLKTNVVDNFPEISRNTFPSLSF
tara:strand:- start:3938 stop:5008 length:1071 start_codon:yes stop_codon:yes gene_type:complete